jgi:hypothetical protein
MLNDPQMQLFAFLRRQHIRRESSIGQHQAPAPHLIMEMSIHVTRIVVSLVAFDHVSRGNRHYPTPTEAKSEDPPAGAGLRVIIVADHGPVTPENPLTHVP